MFTRPKEFHIGSMKLKRNQVKEGKLSLYINVRKDLLESQVLDIDERVVIAAAHGRKIHYASIANELARRCLAAGVFELSFNGAYKGKIVKFIKFLRRIGIAI
ncbi:MAG: hypothetical protein ACTS41_00320 [Candidatus Hodgkinia cicadicola]